MSHFLPLRCSSPIAVACCARCQSKVQYADLVQDPNNQLWVCKDCCDLLDPYRLPARQAENISLQHPRPDVALETD